MPVAEPAGLVAGGDHQIAAERDDEPVITSYSIHYTKLYEVGFPE